MARSERRIECTCFGVGGDDLPRAVADAVELERLHHAESGCVPEDARRAQPAHTPQAAGGR